MTKEELKLQAKITKLEDANKKLEEEYKKPKRKLPMSASHLTLYIILGVYLTTAIFGIVVSAILMKQYPEYMVQIIIALFSFVGVCGTGTIGFYTAKASKENEISSNMKKFETYLKIIREMSKDFSQNKISQDGMMWFNILRQENSTTISTNGFGGITTIDNTNFSTPNPTSNTSISDVVSPEVSIPIDNTNN